MAKVKYRVCDICHESMDNPSKFTMLIHFLFGMDVCVNCLDKLKRLSIDREEEMKYINEICKCTGKYEDDDCEIAYCQGVEDALNVLSHRRLK